MKPRAAAEGIVADAHAQLDEKLRAFVGARVAPHDVDDLTQEIYVRLAAIGDEIEHLSGFVHRVARNVIADHHRRASRTEPVPEEDIAQTDDEAEARRVASWLKPMVESLPEPYAEALRLAELQGLSHQQAAERLGIPRSTFSSRVRKARTLLRQTLTRCCHIELDVRNRVTGFEANASKSSSSCCD